jgi:peptidoglycan/LPS O-acetylase OafA/YrhL
MPPRIPTMIWTDRRRLADMSTVTAAASDRHRPDRDESVEKSGKHRNNFHLLRLLAALQVAFVHAVEWLRIPVPERVMHAVGLFPGVTIFFAISGYLITDSYLRSPRSYALNRMLRIYPALWVCFGVTVLIAWYFGQFDGVPMSRIAPWVLGQLTFLQFTPGFLRDFGTGSMNGVLWTIMVELQFYVVLPLLLGFVATSWRRFGALFAVALALGSAYLWLREKQHGSKLEGLMFRLVLSWLYVFLVGVFLRLCPPVLERIKGKAPSILLAYVLLTLLIGIRLPVTGNDATPFTTIPLAFLTISAAYTLPRLSERLLGYADISYGLYIYHMLVINVLVHNGYLGGWGYLMLALGVSILLATLSWNVIEHPALNLKKRSWRSRALSSP